MYAVRSLLVVDTVSETMILLLLLFKNCRPLDYEVSKKVALFSAYRFCRLI